MRIDYRDLTGGGVTELAAYTPSAPIPTVGEWGMMALVGMHMLRLRIT